MIDFKDIYIDQEGVVWDWAYAKCPRCNKKAKPEDHHFTSMTSFLCPECDLLYDEPHWETAEQAFVTCVSDDEAEHDPELRPYWLWYHDKEPCPEGGA